MDNIEKIPAHKHRKELDINSFKLAIELVNAYPYRTLFVLLALFIAGILEVLSAATLFPLIANFQKTTNIDNDFYQQMLNFMSAMNISMTFNSMLLIIVTLISLKALFSLIAMRHVGYTMANLGNELRLKLISASMKAKWSHFNTLPLGKTSNALGIETNRAAQTYISLCRMISELVVVLIYLATTFFISWELTTAAVVIGIIVIVVLSRFVKMVKVSGRKQTHHMQELSNLITDSIASVKIIKAMGREDHFINILKKESDHLANAKKKSVIGNQTLRVIREPIIILIIAISIYIFNNYSQDLFSTVSFATLITLSFMFLRIVQKLTNVQTIYQIFVANESAYISLKDSIKKTIAHKEVHHGNQIPILKEAIYFKNISYAYQQSSLENDIFCNVNCLIPAYKLNAIIGPSGSGKTTLIDLLVGFYKPDTGHILLDDQKLCDVDIVKWRQSIGYVPQESNLLHDTVFNNISMGNADISEDDVKRALSLSGAYDFVQNLENGIHENIGERGQKLSGGQRQRLAIARALVNNPQLLILDEATSALDLKTGHAIMNTIKDISVKITVIAISHDEAIKEYADHIFFINQKKVKAVK